MAATTAHHTAVCNTPEFGSTSTPYLAIHISQHDRTVLELLSSRLKSAINSCCAGLEQLWRRQRLITPRHRDDAVAVPPP